MVNIPLIS